MLEQARETRGRLWRRLLLPTLLAGIILPTISIVVEATTHMSAEDLFDPIPTLWHLLLVAFVPLAHLQVWLAIRKGSTQRGPLLGMANAVAMGVSIFYTIVYLPVLPLAAIAVTFGGLGLLPMAPLFSLLSGIALRRRLRGIAPRSFAFRRGGLVAGLSLAFALIFLMELPASLTRVGLQMAASESPERSARGLRLLRMVGDKDYMLRACYERTGHATDFVGFLFSLDEPVSPEDARKIYFRLMGETFNTSLPPERVGSHFMPRDRFDFDPDQGGTVIAGKVKGLALTASRMDGSVDAEAGLGYIEWTMVFKNDSVFQHEARAEVQLPPGGVVSRLTLWVDGQEREAAFAARSQARGAYERVVRQRRDPLLVTTAGHDRILVQCFPIQPRGGEMKIRLGITTPLMLEERAQARLRLPHLINRNFRIPELVSHAVWIESESPMHVDAQGLETEQPGAGIYAVRGAVSDAELSERGAFVRFARASEVGESWTRDDVKHDGELVRQLIREKSIPARSRIVLVLDTSRSMAAWREETSAALKSLPADVRLTLLLADGNGVYEVGASQHPLSGKPEEIAPLIESVRFEGGADNVAPLLKAWDIAAASPLESVIIWVHGPQPLLLQGVEGLRQRWERQPLGPMLYAVQAGNGPDLIAEGLDGIGAFEVSARAGGLQSDLEGLLAELTGRAKPLEFVRTRERLEPLPASPAVRETSAHLARLWANDEVARLLAARGKDWEEEATKLATLYQLVTPVSGAVVLETQAQYDQAGLQAVAPGTVPTIPEPEMYLLIAVVMAMLLWLLYRRRLNAPLA
jgi:hypothetical protein